MGILLKHLSNQRQKEIINKDDLVFPNSHGKHMNYQNFLSRIFLPAVEKAGLKRVTPHTLRHSYVAAMISAGQNIKYIQRQLGHADIRQTLDTYGHLLPDAEKDAAEKLNAIFATAELPQEGKETKR